MTEIWNLENLKRLLEDKFEERILGKFKGKIFIFDKESYNEFKKFQTTHWIDVEDGYLIGERKNEPDKWDFFHVWLMQEEVQLKKKYFKDIEVHHTTYCKRINMRKFLKALTKKEHNKLHWSEIPGHTYGGIKIPKENKDLNEYLDRFYIKKTLNLDTE